MVGDSDSTAVYAQDENEARFQMDVYAPSFTNTTARAAKVHPGASDIFAKF